MIRHNFKQAWELIKQNKLFTSIYIIGTGMAIATTMIMAIVYYVKIAPIYPEENRSHISYLSEVSFVSKDKGANQWNFSHIAVKEWFYQMKNVEAVSASYYPSFSLLPDNYVQPMDKSGDFSVSTKMTDPAFFRIYNFRFIEGKPFSDNDMASGMRSVVITDDLARRLYGTVKGIIGQNFSMDYLNYRITGVVEGGSLITKRSFAQVYMPYTSVQGFDQLPMSSIPYYGKFQLTFLTKSAEQEKAMREEVNEFIRKYNTSQSDWEANIMNQPITHMESEFQQFSTDTVFDWWAMFRQYFIIFLVLLLVPALNLSGMIASRMDARLSEMGIRKSFGANKGGLLRQVISENLLLTLLGGILGMIIAWTLLYVFRDWVFSIFEKHGNIIPDGLTVNVSGEMLVAPLVFLFAMLVCMLLNLLSALIPAWYSLKNPIVKSLNEKR